MKTFHIPSSDDDTFLQIYLKSHFGVNIKCFHRCEEKDVCLSLKSLRPYICICVVCAFWLPSPESRMQKQTQLMILWKPLGRLSWNKRVDYEAMPSSHHRQPRRLDH